MELREKYMDNGGYIEDFKEIQKKANIDVNNVSVEYVDKISCSNGKEYTNSLVLCNNYYSISLI